MNPWYLLYCKRSEQERALVNLNRQGVNCYYPTVTIEKLRRGKRVEVVEPLFPCYMFVSFDPEAVSFTSVRSSRGVADFVRFGGYPQQVSEEVVFAIMEAENAEKNSEKLSEMPQAGEAFVLEHGQFKGYDAIYKEPDGEKRSIMFVTMMGKQVEVSVSNRAL
ncbi:transcription/translation regulatory transformer protein RfaH [Thaumasiovibrio sp. DFM-14]|uniref:transcription/translation regulatory transformer protein RfaH n=1 Tax=Thaumasiovibrio sp. DFM-14 TaxID=3384792 RepID=UPI00399F9874